MPFRIIKKTARQSDFQSSFSTQRHHFKRIVETFWRTYTHFFHDDEEMWHGSFHNLISKLWENLKIYFSFSRFLCGLTFHQHFAATLKTITFAVFYCYSQLFSRQVLHFFPIPFRETFSLLLEQRDVKMMISNRLVRTFL